MIPISVLTFCHGLAALLKLQLTLPPQEMESYIMHREHHFCNKPQIRERKEENEDPSLFELK